jgi:thiamine biosynthesis protein ThiS
MKIFINGEQKILSNQKTIQDLIKFYDLDIRKVAIEKDLEVITPDKYNSTTLNENCKIEIVHFIGGG